MGNPGQRQKVIPMITNKYLHVCSVCSLCIIFLGFGGLAQEKPAVLAGEYVGMKTPERRPLLFAPAVVSTGYHEHSAPTFSPDGKEIYWSVFKDVNQPQLIMCMKSVDGVWTLPMTAPFSGEASSNSASLFYVVIRSRHDLCVPFTSPSLDQKAHSIPTVGFFPRLSSRLLLADQQRIMDQLSMSLHKIRKLS